jgi:hypothetical protein
MEQRRLRLGDIVDDYCPRERRVTNHAVVAMIEEEIKQTRCATCDADHPYKGGQAPRRKKKETSSALFKEVLAGKPEDAPHLTSAAHAARAGDIDDTDHADHMDEEEFADEPVVPASADAVPAERNQPGAPRVPLAALNEDEPEPRGDTDRGEGPVHRPLIRATLPRPEGQKEVRNPPDFTIRQSGGRGNAGNQQFRGGGGGGGGGNARMRPRGGGQANGHRPQGAGGHGRFAGARPAGPGGQGRGQGGGNFRTPQQPRHGGSNRKRSR